MAVVGNQRLRLSDRVLGVLEQVEYRRVTDPRDLGELYRLRHDAYVREGAIERTPDGLFTDDVDDDDNTYVLGVYIDGELAGSIRLSIGRAGSGVPTGHVFPEHVEPLMCGGRAVVDPTRFVACWRMSRAFPELPYLTLRLPWMAMDFFEADVMLAAVRPEHQAFYQRLWGNRLVCSSRDYPSLRKPVSLSVLPFAEVRDDVEDRLPFFRSTIAERNAIFGHRSGARAMNAVAYLPHESSTC